MAKRTEPDQRSAPAARRRAGAHPPSPAQEDSSSGEETSGRASAVPEFMRRAMALGLSSFFTTEEALRKALGDTLPKDWLDFASSQSQRTREEFMDRLSTEFGNMLAKIDIAELLERLLEGRTLEVRAQIRLEERETGTGSVRPARAKVDVSVSDGTEKGA